MPFYSRTFRRSSSTSCLESKLLSVFVVGALSLWKKDPFYVVFYQFLFSDLLWLIPMSSWFISAGMSLFLLWMNGRGFTVAGICLLREIWWFHILPRFPGYFTLSESVLLERWLILFTTLIFSPTTTLEMRCTAIITLSSILFTGMTIIYCKNAASCYATIFLGAVLEVLLLSACTHQFFIRWLFNWVFETTVRPLIFLYWIVVLFLALIIICGDQMQPEALIIRRKYFHFLAVVLFLPVMLIDPSFMQYQCKLFFLIEWLSHLPSSLFCSLKSYESSSYGHTNTSILLWSNLLMIEMMVLSFFPTFLFCLRALCLCGCAMCPTRFKCSLECLLSVLAMHL